VSCNCAPTTASSVAPIDNGVLLPTVSTTDCTLGPLCPPLCPIAAPATSAILLCKSATCNGRCYSQRVCVGDVGRMACVLEPCMVNVVTSATCWSESQASQGTTVLSYISKRRIGVRIVWMQQTRPAVGDTPPSANSSNAFERRHDTMTRKCLSCAQRMSATHAR
jgi:hypothetical protein